MIFCFFTKQFISLWGLFSIFQGSSAISKDMSTNKGDNNGINNTVYRGEPLHYWQPEHQFDDERANEIVKLKNENKPHRRGGNLQTQQISPKFGQPNDKNNKNQPTGNNPKFNHEKSLDSKNASLIDPKQINFRAKTTMKIFSERKKDDKKKKIFSDNQFNANGYTRISTPKVRQAENNKGEEEILPRLAGPLNIYALIPQFEKIFQNFPEANVTHEIIGRTASYNDIVLFKLSKSLNGDAYLRADDSKYVDEVPEKNIVFIVHALSAMGIAKLFSLTREKYLETLLSYYLNHLDKFDIFFIPMANPDGYSKNRVITQNEIGNRPWNKNLSPQTGCPGVDLDRNFDVAWNSSHGTSTCSQHYPGATPFSEPESIAVRDVFHQYSHKIVAYFHVHAGSYNRNTFKSDAVLYPRGYTDVPIDDDKYLDMKGEIDEAMKNATFRAVSVTVDTLHNWYGKVSGTSVDYASTIYGIPFAMELVMQIYMEPLSVFYSAINNEKDAIDIEYYALTEIWRRVLDCIFNSISKTSQAND